MSLESRAPIGTVDSINTTGVRLVDIDCHAFQDGDQIYCKSNDSFYAIQLNKNYIIDNSKYVTAKNLSNGQWIQVISTDTSSGSTTLGFFNTTPVAQQSVGANVNNVTASGVTGRFDDFTDGATYATDYPALHATISQLTKTVTQLTVALRAYGLVQ